jgi:hypothetical protein
VSRLVEELLAIAKLEARKRGRAVRVSAVMRVEPDPDAFLLAPIKMPGEGRLWGAAYGRRGEEPQFCFAADPRNRDDETKNAIAPLARDLDAYFNHCLEQKRAPQVWVSSSAAVRFLDALGERRTTPDYPSVALLGRHAYWLTDRFCYAGQQVMLSAVNALSAHIATGQSPFEDQHLGALLAWVEPPPDQIPEAAARLAEEIPAGVNTDVELDYELEPLLAELAELRREGRDAARETEIADAVREALKPMALRIYGLIERAILALERQDLEIASRMDDLRQDDYRSFSFYMTRDFIPLRPSPREAARLLAEREDAVDKAARAFVQEDVIEKAVAQVSGDVLHGIVTDAVYGNRAGSIHELEITTSQAVSALRIGDHVRVDAPTTIELQLIAQGSPDAAGERQLRFRVGRGKMSLEGFLDEEVALLPGGGGFFERGSGQLGDPWVIDPRGRAPQSLGHPVPQDPLADLEVLR